jgi:5-methyltetrahydropteroyltriglutamate--homocysteine methyltransferase
MRMTHLPHGDVVGSLLRPPELLAAREAIAAGTIADAEFKRVEDRAVDDAVALQEEAGLEIVTDGEMRRLSFQGQMLEAIEGFGEFDLNAFLWGDWHGDEGVGDRKRDRPTTLGVVGKLRRKRHLSAEEFTYLRRRTTRIPKATLPSPSLFASFWSPATSKAAYATRDAFLADVAGIVRDEIAELVRLGATYIQLDAPHYPLVMDPTWTAFYGSQGRRAEDWLVQSVELDNAVMGGFEGVTFAFHL